MPGFPIALNPFKTRVPTTRLGSFGKLINPLNPVNAATILLQETIGALVGKTLGPEAEERVGYFSFGIPAGTALNVLNAGSVNAEDDARLIAESNRYFNSQKALKQPVRSGVVPGASQATSFVASTPKAQDSPQAVAPRTEPRSISVPTTATPSVEEKNALAIEYMKQELLGRTMAESGELQRRLFEAGGSTGMTPENFVSWVESHPDIAYRELLKREKTDAVASTF